MNVGVLGAGWWGKRIISTLEEIDVVKQVFVYDVDKSASALLSGKSKCTFVDSLDGIYGKKSVEAVCISTPPGSHYALTKQAMTLGKHVFVEKPPASTLREVQELGTISVGGKLVYMLDALYLFATPLRDLKELLASRLLNDIRFIEIHRIGDELRRDGAGIQRIRNTMYNNDIDVIEDIFFHDAGILVFLFERLSVKSVRRYFMYDKNICDTAIVNLVHDGIDIQMTISWTLAGRRRGLVIYDKNYIVEYDALAKENQMSIFRIEDQGKTLKNYNDQPLLKSNLEYFFQTILQKSKNFIDHEFMEKAMLLKEQVMNARGE